MIGGALAAFMMTLPTPAPAAQNSRAQPKQRASPAAAGAIKHKAAQDLGAKLLTKRRLQPTP
jgi:hypothetical protein